MTKQDIQDIINDIEDLKNKYQFIKGSVYSLEAETDAESDTINGAIDALDEIGDQVSSLRASLLKLHLRHN